jgi:tetratricopeptide (TPR) repeat protein/energy-coupling factor transporter ATP-binding protein EcfA2
MAVEPSIDPFPGLRPFEANEGYLFFGREGQSEETLRRLRQHRFLAVVGSSGSGKSSLVRAGLLPYLYGGFLAKAGSHWRVAIFRPGSDPIGNLAGALNDPAVLGKPTGNPAEAAQSGVLIEVSLRRSGLGLIEAVRLAGLAEQEQVLVVIDQFEELFRFGGTAGEPHQDDDAAAFVKLLLEASRQNEVPIYVVLTMRSDFIGDCARYRGLPEAVTTGLYLIPRMTRDQRRSAIVEPVRVGGGSITPRLVNRVLNDVGDDPDQLPILQHALMRAWDYWKTHGGDQRPIDIEDYVAIGGSAEALSQHADEAYASLPDDRHRAIARRVFQALCEKGPDRRETRRPTTVETLAQVAGVPVSDIIRVLEEFRRPGRSFVMPAPGVALDAGSVIDISHESLIRGWQRLRQWVDEEAETATVYRRLAETAALHAQGTAGLWHDPDLQHALAWRDKERPTAAWGNRYHAGFEQAMAFLEQSRAAREAERRKQVRSRRRALAATVGALAVVTVLALVALFLWRRAVHEEQTAGLERDRAEQALAAVTQTADNVVFDIVQALRLRGVPSELTDEMLDRAIQGYDQAIRLSPNTYAYTGRGMAYWMKGDFDRAIADTEQAIKLDPTYARAHNVRGMAFLDKTDEVHAIAEYDEAIRLDPYYARPYNNRGNLHHKNKDFERAIADYDRAILLEEKNAVTYRNRGIVYYDRQQYDLAIRDYDKAIAIDPKYVVAYNNRGNAYYDKKDYDRAIADYDHAIALDPKYVIAYNNRGYAYYEKKDYDHAIADYDHALALDPKYVYAYNNRGLFYANKDDYARAIAEYDRAIEFDPNYAQAYGNRGDAYLNTGDPGRAFKDYDQRIRLQPKSARSYLNRAMSEIYLDKPVSAVDDLETAVGLQPTDHYLVIWLHIARTRAGQRDLDKIAAFAKGLNQAEWPWPVLGLVLGSLSPEAVRAAAQSADDATTLKNQVCEADFYLGIHLQDNGARDEARQLFKSAAEGCPKNFWEYMAAKLELRNSR